MRDKGVTIAKGIAIILMVMGHAKCPELLNQYLRLLRMPLFFFMSGYCFKTRYLDESISYLKKRIKGIYVPYIKWSIFFLLLHNIFCYLNLYNDLFPSSTSHVYSIKEYISHFIRIVTSMTGHDRLLSPYWFLRELFWGSIIFYFTKKYVKKSYLSLVLLLSLTLFLSVLNIRVPYLHIGSLSFFAAFFIYIGNYYKENHFSFENKYSFILLGMSFVLVGSIFWPTSMLMYKWYQVIPYAVTAVVGTLVILGISRKISNSGEVIPTLLDFIGNNTFIVLTWHLLAFKLVSLLYIYYTNIDIRYLAAFTTIESFALSGGWILYTIVGSLLPVVITFYSKKIFGFNILK